MERLGGRKFVLTIGAVLLATAIELFTERGITESYGLLLAGLIGVYGASNVAITRKALNAEMGEVEVPSTPPAELVLLQAQVETQGQTLAQVAESVGMTNQLLLQAMQAGQQQAAKPAAGGLASQALANKKQ